MRLLLGTFCALALTGGIARASTVWSAGPGDVTITKPSGADPSAPASQDRINANVWIARGDTQGLYNAASESGFDGGGLTSPAGTEWAFSGLAGDPSFAYGAGAANHASLSFESWTPSLGGAGSLAGNILNRPGVLHLLSSDIYIDIEFTSFDTGHSSPSGGFSYVRAVAPVSAPEPASLAILAGAAPLLFRRRKNPQ